MPSGPQMTSNETKSKVPYIGFTILTDTQGRIQTSATDSNASVRCHSDCPLYSQCHSTASRFQLCLVLLHSRATAATLTVLFTVSVTLQPVVFSSALCYCTAELLPPHRNPSSLRKTRFLRTRQTDQCQIWQKGTFSPFSR